MAREKIFSKPFDKVHTILYNEFPAEYIKTIGVPGVFVKKINRRVNLKNGAGGEMDSAFILDPDYKILHERVAGCLEHQSGPVKSIKLKKFGDYDIQMVFDENLPTFLIVASHLNPHESKNMLIRSPSDITKLYFLDLGEENINKRLNTVNKIIKSNKYLSTENALNLGVILLYAPREHACEITEKVADLYCDICEGLDFKMESCLYLVISIMTDAFFDDEEEYWRIMNMIDGKATPETKEAFAATKQSLMESSEWAKEDLANANKKIAELEAENSKIPELKAEIARLNAQLNGK